jgi:hypothetical protein
MEATKTQDCTQIVKAFQKKLLSASDEGSIMGGMMAATAMMQVNAVSASGNLANAISPPIPQIILDALAAASAVGPKVKLPSDTGELLRSLTKGNELAGLGLEWLERCVPCALRIKFRSELAFSLSDLLLDILEDMLNNFLKELAFIMNMLNSTDVYQDACLLIKSLEDVCIPDIQRMISLLSAILYRTTSKEIMQQVDIMKLLIYPIFQPIFTNITQLFGQYKSLVTDPLQCVVSQLNAQLEKIKTGGFLNNSTINSIETRTIELEKIAKISGVEGIAGPGEVDFQSDEVKTSLKNAQQAGLAYDGQIGAMQDSLGSAVFHLRRMVMSGIVEVESVLSELQSELQKFVGGGQEETLEFLLAQYDKLLVVRMIQFLSAMVTALAGGFSCDIPNEEAGNVVLAQFFDQFLGPQSPVILQVDPVTNDVILTLDSGVLQPLAVAGEASINLSANSQVANPPILIDPTGNNEVDQAVSAIIKQAVTPVRVKPRCFFDTQRPDDDRLAAILAELN